MGLGTNIDAEKIKRHGIFSGFHLLLVPLGALRFVWPGYWGVGQTRIPFDCYNRLIPNIPKRHIDSLISRNNTVICPRYVSLQKRLYWCRDGKRKYFSAIADGGPLHLVEVSSVAVSCGKVPTRYQNGPAFIRYGDEIYCCLVVYRFHKGSCGSTDGRSSSSICI